MSYVRDVTCYLSLYISLYIDIYKWIQLYVYNYIYMYKYIIYTFYSTVLHIIFQNHGFKL